jgi:hypothetical protein
MDPNQRDENGNTLLVNACFEGDSAQIRNLLLSGADPNMSSKDGYTPIIAASRDNGTPEIIELLLEYGADINVLLSQDTDESALSEAVYWDNTVVVKTLIEHGIDLCKRGAGALFNAVYWKKPEMLHILLTRGTPPDALDCSGCTPLMWAAINNNLEAVRQLLESGADPAFCARNGISVYFHARLGRDKTIIAIIKERLAKSPENQFKLLKGMFLPSDYMDYISAGQHLKFKFSKKAELSFATLCTMADIRNINIMLNPSIEYKDLNTKRQGKYILPVLDLVEDVGTDFNSMGILVWIPDIKLFGTWDSDHYELTVFKDKTWADILAAPEIYFNAMWQPYLNYGIVPVADVVDPASLWKFVEDEK